MQLIKEGSTWIGYIGERGITYQYICWIDVGCIVYIGYYLYIKEG